MTLTKARQFFVIATRRYLTSLLQHSHVTFALITTILLCACSSTTVKLSAEEKTAIKRFSVTVHGLSENTATADSALSQLRATLGDSLSKQYSWTMSDSATADLKIVVSQRLGMSAMSAGRQSEFEIALFGRDVALIGKALEREQSAIRALILQGKSEFLAHRLTEQIESMIDLK